MEFNQFSPLPGLALNSKRDKFTVRGQGNTKKPRHVSFSKNHDSKTWFDATLVYRFNDCNRRSYNCNFFGYIY